MFLILLIDKGLMGTIGSLSIVASRLPRSLLASALPLHFPFVAILLRFIETLMAL